MLDALDGGNVLLADELDASLHPRRAEQLIRLFQDRVTNPNGAQLLFNAHNPVFLGDSADRPIGRDQVWITEKANDGTSRLCSLAEFSPRQDEALGRRYMQGRYGGLPVIDPSGFERAAEASNRTRGWTFEMHGRSPSPGPPSSTQCTSRTARFSEATRRRRSPL